MQRDERKEDKISAPETVSPSVELATVGQLIQLVLGTKTPAELPDGKFKQAIAAFWDNDYKSLNKTQFQNLGQLLNADRAIPAKPVLLKLLESMNKRVPSITLANEIGWNMQQLMMHHLKTSLQPGDEKITPQAALKDIAFLVKNQSDTTPDAIAKQYFKAEAQAEVACLIGLFKRITTTLAEQDRIAEMKQTVANDRIARFTKMKEVLEAKGVDKELEELKKTNPERFAQLEKNYEQIIFEGNAGFLARDHEEFLAYVAEHLYPDIMPGMPGPVRIFMGFSMSSKDTPKIRQVDQTKGFVMASTNMGAWCMDLSILSETERAVRRAKDQPITIKPMIDVTPCDDRKAFSATRELVDVCTPALRSNTVALQAPGFKGFGRDVVSTYTTGNETERKQIAADTLNTRVGGPGMRFMDPGECVFCVSVMKKAVSRKFLDIQGLTSKGSSCIFDDGSLYGVPRQEMTEGHMNMIHTGDIDPGQMTYELAQALGIEFSSLYAYQMALLDPGDPRFSEGKSDVQTHTLVSMGSWEEAISEGLGAFKFISFKFESDAHKEQVKRMITKRDYRDFGSSNVAAVKKAMALGRGEFASQTNMDAFAEAKAYASAQFSIATVAGKNVLLFWFQPIAFLTQAGSSEEMLKLIQMDLDEYLKSDIFKQRFARLAAMHPSLASGKLLTGEELYILYHKYREASKELLQDPSKENRAAYDLLYNQLQMYFPLFKLSDYGNPLRAVCDIMKANPDWMCYMNVKEVLGKAGTGGFYQPQSALFVDRVLGELGSVVRGVEAGATEFKAISAVSALPTASAVSATSSQPQQPKSTQPTPPAPSRPRERARYRVGTTSEVKVSVSALDLATLPVSAVKLDARPETYEFYKDLTKGTKKEDEFYFPSDYDAPQTILSTPRPLLRRSQSDALPVRVHQDEFKGKEKEVKGKEKEVNEKEKLKAFVAIDEENKKNKKTSVDPLVIATPTTATSVTDASTSLYSKAKSKQKAEETEAGKAKYKVATKPHKPPTPV